MFDSLRLAVLRFRQLALSQRRTIAIVRRGAGEPCRRVTSISEGFLYIPVFALALMAQAAQPDAGSGQSSAHTDIVQLIRDASLLSQAVLVILLLFSAIGWGITLYKMFAYKRASRQTASFLDVFRKSSKFSEVQAVCPSLTDSPLVGLFQSGYAELNAQLRHNPNDPAKPPAAAGRPTLKSLESVDRALLRASTVEMTKLERHVPFLATTASITPFIGLFGTVWGIMGSFNNIGAAGSAGLSVVAPGIAEALIATAAGLFAAIPAVYFYNLFTQRVKEFAAQMDDFSLEFLNICERNFT
jgi:biopolymer transport protein TolQ